MSYLNYVVAAYLVFVVVLLWDFLAPRLRTRQLLRASRSLAARKAATPKPDTQGELQR